MTYEENRLYRIRMSGRELSWSGWVSAVWRAGRFYCWSLTMTGNAHHVITPAGVIEAQALGQSILPVFVPYVFQT